MGLAEAAPEQAAEREPAEAGALGAAEQLIARMAKPSWPALGAWSGMTRIKSAWLGIAAYSLGPVGPNMRLRSPSRRRTRGWGCADHNVLHKVQLVPIVQSPPEVIRAGVCNKGFVNAARCVRSGSTPKVRGVDIRTGLAATPRMQVVDPLDSFRIGFDARQVEIDHDRLLAAAHQHAG